jgi:hypothetical protein
MDVNDNACILNARGASKSIASKPAPTVVSVVFVKSVLKA